MVVAASCCGVFLSGKDWETSEEQSTEILDENLLQSSQVLSLGGKFTFQQDNDPKHTDKTTQEWLRDKSLNVLE